MSEESKYTQEMYMTAPDMVLVDSRQVNIGAGIKLGDEEGARPCYFITLEGRVNRSEERKVVHLCMSVEDGFAFSGQLMDMLEIMMNASREQGS